MIIKTGKLTLLAKHLLEGELAHKEFNFGYINYGDTDSSGCGTVGCALGELPIVFPRDFKFIPNRVVPKKQEEWSSYLINKKQYKEFFGLNDEYFHHLFYPDSQDIQYGKLLTREATKEEVAINILRFCRLVKEKIIKDSL